MRRSMLLLAVAMSCVAADKPDLTGTWICNLDQSKFGKMAKPQSLILKVERKGEVLHAVQTKDDGQGGRAEEGDWFLDGKVHPVDPKAADPNKMTTMSKWQGNTLLAERKSSDGTFDEKIRLTLSSDNKKATEHITVKAPTGGGDSTLVWEKK